ncbi:MAG: hypothetical protein LBE56_07095 [Tannerella sp.]|nr:hypothetical protein [Tannerella sp.]
MTGLHHIKKTLSFLLITLFLSYYAGTTFFSHSHVINGATIIHSHPHAESHHDTAGGNHTEHSITLIAQISHVDCTNLACTDIFYTPNIPQTRNIDIATTHTTNTVYLNTLSLRAPPSSTAAS